MTATYTHPRSGYEQDIEKGKRLLTLGRSYEVKRVDVGDWMSYVELVDFPGERFNSVLFNLDPVPEALRWVEEVAK